MGRERLATAIESGVNMGSFCRNKEYDVIFSGFCSSV